jgi:hypothetical protein
LLLQIVPKTGSISVGRFSNTSSSFKLLPVDQIAITIAVITITLTKLIRNETGKVNHGEEVALQWACSWLDPKHPSESIGLSIQVHTRG